MILIHDRLYDKFVNKAFSRYVTEAMLVYLNNGTAAMLVNPTNPPGIEPGADLAFFESGGRTRILISEPE